ncbi:MAG: cytochrome c oxidase assembly protein, partial [Dehalococcoidia bacterium]
FTVFIALVSPVDRLAGDLFFMHMVQHELLVLVAAPLLLLSAPMLPLLRGVPRPVRQRLVIPVAKAKAVRSTLGFLTQPAIAWGLFVIVFFGWHLPPLYAAAQNNDAVHILAHVTLTWTALLFWWNVVDPLPLRPKLSYLARVPYIFLMTLPNLLLSAFVTFSDTPWYAIHEVRALLHGITALEDQQIGGAIMWIPGSFIMGAALLINLWMSVKSEERNQRARERLQQRAAS